MERFIRTIALALLLLPATSLHAELSFAVTPSLGIATVSNLDGYNDAGYLRVDGSFFPLPQVGVNIFVTGYQDFEANRGNEIAIAVGGSGLGVIGRWPLDPHFIPYLRGEYFLWNVKASALDRTLAEEDGHSAGFAIGAQFPIKKFFGVRAELAGYNNVSGADLRQISIGAMFEF